MKIIRLKVENFRGVEQCEVRFAPSGITVIEGPNEVGKSSLVEAMDLLFEMTDNATHKRLKAVRPFHLKGPTAVELEFITGDYHLEYSKQWFSKPATLLRILAPKPMNVSGREAHEKVHEILSATLDMELFRALRVVQGEKVDQPDSSGTRSLTAALDEASEGSGESDTENSLRDAIYAEYLKYFTPTGKPIAAREKLASALVSAENAFDQANRKVASLAEYGEALDRVTAQCADLTSRMQEDSIALVELDKLWDQMNAVANTIAPLQTEVANAKTKLVEAQGERDQRAGLVESVERGQAGLEQTVRTIESLNPRAEAAGRKEIQAKEELDEAIGISSEAAIRADEADSFYLFRRAELDSRLLFGRYESYVESSTAESRANRFLAECKITDRDLPAIEQADLALLKARSALDVARPSVEFEALDSVAVQINGVMRTLARGERDSLPIAQNNELIVDSRLALRITSGVAVEQLESELENQVRRVGSLASQFALDPIDPIGDARRQLVRRAVELQALQSARNAKSQALQDFSLIEELVGKLDQARNLVETFLAGRDPGLPDPPELEDAEIYRRDAFQARDQASRNLDSKRVFFEAMREERQEATREIGELKSVTRDAELRLHEDLKRLDASRQLVSDEQLAQLCAIAEQGHLAAVTKLDEANQKLSTFQPDELELRRQNAKAVDKRHRDEEKVLIARQSELRGSLSSLGDQDLQDAANAAEGELEVVRTAHAKMERDAGAAQLLFETFERHREKLRLAYVEPYSEEIHRLARIVFGTQTQIEIDPSNLSIVARTKDGVTVPYASLSTGAREQLGIIARLACARLVGRKVDSPAGESTQGTPKNDGEYGASDIGVPLIFDDALGHSDHERLGSLGVVLDSVGRQVQVIVLTADRARFDKVGNATFVSLN